MVAVQPGSIYTRRSSGRIRSEILSNGFFTFHSSRPTKSHHPSIRYILQ